MKANRVGKKTINAITGMVNFITLTVILLLLAYAGYALWDSSQIYQAADKSHYAVYKPTVEDEGKSFKELQALNSEVIAWLNVYGTNIDYPVAQGQDNMKYVNTNAEGLYSLSGAIFLDYQNSMDFTDFNSILYGHHMEKNTMFGEIGNFSDRNVFDSHLYGNLYFNESDHGIEFFAFVHADAYDNEVFRPNVKGEARERYLDNLLAKAIHTRDIGVTIQDRIVLLSTCSLSSTNGRDILIGRLNDEAYDDPMIKTAFVNETKEKSSTDSLYGFVKEIPLWVLIIIVVSIVVLLVRVLDLIINKNSNKKQNTMKGGSGR